jgi:hypothetical protein
MLPTRSLEEKTPVWFPPLPAIYQAARQRFTDKSATFFRHWVFHRFSSQAA